MRGCDEMTTPNIPAGGHTGDALACRNASLSPSLPAMK